MLKIIALISLILTAIITAGAIFSAVFPTFATFITTNFSWVAPIFASYIKPAITTAISVFVFAVSKLFLSYLSKQKESESQDLKRFGTNVDKENQNEIAINKNIGQIPKQGNDQVVTENRLNSK